MSTKSIAIAYCMENEPVANSITEQLSLSNYSFQPFPCTRTTAEAALSEQLLNQPAPILLIVSDNFLKSAQCMSRGLKLLQEKRQQILPIVIDGVTKDDQSGEVISIPTEFERVSDIIQYINYWQDRYLDLRRQKRQIEDFDENAFNAHLKAMREISSEAGEFLRVLRSMEYISFQEFSANNYEKFFQFVNDHNSWVQFKSQAPAAEAPPIAVTDIPGIELLPDEKEEEASGEPTAGSAPPEVEEGIADAQEDSAPAEEEEEAAPPLVAETPPPVFVEEEEEEDTQEGPLGDAADMYQQQDAEPEEEKEEEEEDEYYEAPEEEEEEELEDATEGSLAQDRSIVEEAMDYFNTGQTQEGLSFLGQAVEERPDSPYLRYHFALMLAQKAQEYQLARTVLKPVLQGAPENEDALFLMGELDELQHDFEAAREHYEALVALNAKYPNAYYRLGMITANHFEEDKKEAAKYFKKATKLDDNNADAYYQYALLLNEALGKPKKALKYLRKTLELNAHHPFANYDLAIVYHQLGERQKAKHAYARAITINPELQTPENDLAFAPSKEPSGIAAGIEHDTIEALKDNINQLEELLQSREEEAQQLRQSAEEEAEPERPSVDETVFISGATSGIGRATAEVFASHGYRVIMSGRRTDRLEELKDQFEEDYDADIVTLGLDVRDSSAVAHAVNNLSGDWNKIDILINNAGKAKGLAPIHEGKLAHWDEMIDTNLKGLLYLTRAITPGMVERKKGLVINLCSTAGKEVYPNGNVYCATKSAVDALTKAMRLDLHPYNVKVGMISPAHVEETEFALVRFDGNEERSQIYDDFKPLTSRDVAHAIYFMATQPAHVNVLDMVIQGTQQASSTLIDRSGREKYEEEAKE